MTKRGMSVVTRNSGRSREYRRYSSTARSHRSHRGQTLVGYGRAWWNKHR